MSSKTSSGRRRLGREAFTPGVDPLDIQPYKIGTIDYDLYLEDWLEGWREAFTEYSTKAVTFEIHYQDLTEKAQLYLCNRFKTTPEDENWDSIPLTTIERGD